ncbi:hypothetical protein [Actinomadura sp. NEAU-AAG7]|uniref:hypothetical protein n=1 Tax=Actinomadura sp. NEAU-AAG7 TaxID=2839640 RepID=UPI001BE4BF4B|nr:hypothetical protein [Actinomadura sp. NEAU-AAG7]MBT2210795.1 hypothetical protein [Actinomadura sp. NEAU-AAG7]
MSEVARPWNLNFKEISTAVAELRGTSEETLVALSSLDALLRFHERHEAAAAAADDAFPLADRIYWIAYERDLLEAMPTLADLTWPKFHRWAAGFSPSDIDMAWEEPPEEFVRSFGWSWTMSMTEYSTNEVTEWLVKQFRSAADHELLERFLVLLSEHAPKADAFGETLVGAMARAGNKSSLPYLSRLAANAEASAKVREEAEYWLDYCTRT